MNPYNRNYSQNTQPYYYNGSQNPYGPTPPPGFPPKSRKQNPTPLPDPRQLNEEDEKVRPQKSVSNSKLSAFTKSFTPLSSSSTPSFAPSILHASEEDIKVSNSSTQTSKSAANLPISKQTSITPNNSLLSSSSSVSSAAIEIFSETTEKTLEPSKIQTELPPTLASTYIKLDLTSLNDNTLYGIYISTSKTNETPTFDYNNVILCEYQSNRGKKEGSKFLKFQLDNSMPLWLSEINGEKPFLLYKPKEVGSSILHKNPHVFLDSRRKYHLTWPTENNTILKYQIWRMNDQLKREEKVFCSSEGILFNHMCQVPFNAFIIPDTKIADQFESKPAIGAEEFEKEIGYSFKDPKLLDLVLNHNVIRDHIGSNFEQQRLEVLGDAVLDNIIIKHWYDNPSLTTDHWQAMQVFLRNDYGKEYLNQLGILKYSKLIPTKPIFGQEERDPNRKQFMDLFEVLIAAIYLDSGFNVAQAFYLKNFQKYLEDGFKKSIENEAQTEKEKSLKNDPIISLQKAADTQTPQIRETFDQIIGPSLQELRYKFKNPAILEKLKQQWTTNKSIENLIYYSLNHELINSLIAEWLNTPSFKDKRLHFSVENISNWRDHQSVDLINQKTKDTIFDMPLTDEARDSVKDFKKSMILSKYIRKLCVVNFIFNNFPDDTEGKLTEKRSKLLQIMSTSISNEVIVGIYLDQGLEYIQSIIDYLCSEAVQVLFLFLIQNKNLTVSSFRISHMKDYAVDKTAIARLTKEPEDDDSLVTSFEDLHLKDSDNGNQFIKKIYVYGNSKNQPAFIRVLEQRAVNSFKSIVSLKDDLQVGIGIGDSRTKATAAACFELMKKKNLPARDPIKTLELYLQDQVIEDYQLQIKKVDEHSAMARVIVHLNGEEITVRENCKIDIYTKGFQLRLVANKIVPIIDSKLSGKKIIKPRSKLRQISQVKLSNEEDNSDKTIQREWKLDLINFLDWKMTWSPCYNTVKVDNTFISTLYAGEGLKEIGQGATIKAAEQEASKNIMMSLPKSVLDEFQYQQMQKINKTTKRDKQTEKERKKMLSQEAGNFL